MQITHYIKNISNHNLSFYMYEFIRREKICMLKLIFISFDRLFGVFRVQIKKNFLSQIIRRFLYNNVHRFTYTNKYRFNY